MITPFLKVLPLDIVKVAVSAYSLRRLKGSYTGKCIRVRRDSDDTELDIGFSGNGLDTVALLVFVGAGSGYVKTWYDQSGNGSDATQTTISNQPRIVNAGVLDVDINGRPRIVFDNTDNLIKTGLNISNIISISYVGNVLQTNGARLITLTSDNPASNTMVTPSTGSNTSFNVGERFPNQYNINQLNIVDYLTTPVILSYNRLSTTYQELYKNGNNKATNTNTTVNFNITRIYLGSNDVLGAHFLQEFILFRNPLVDSQRQKLERNQGMYYSISI